MVLAAPVLVAALAMGALDRTVQTTFFVRRAAAAARTCTRTCSGSSATPRCTSSPCPGFAIVLELLPVFSRKPLWGYRLAVAGLLGVSLLSWFVWQHHLFVSGINGDLRPFYMLSTELISIPTGFTFLCGMMTLWRGQHPLHRPDALLPRLVLQLPDRRAVRRLPLGRAERRDAARQLLLDGPLPLHDHGRPRLHVLRRDLLLGAEDDRLRAERAAREDPLLEDVHLLQLDLRAALRVGFLGQPRRVVTYAPNLQFLNDWVSVSAFLLGISMLVFLFNLVWSLAFTRSRPEMNPWASRSIEFQLPSPVPCTTSTASRSSRATPTATARGRPRLGRPTPAGSE